MKANENRRLPKIGVYLWRGEEKARMEYYNDSDMPAAMKWAEDLPEGVNMRIVTGGKVVFEKLAEIAGYKIFTT